MVTIEELKAQARSLQSISIGDDVFLKDRVLIKYSNTVGKALLALLDTTPLELSSLESFLENNWSLVKKTALGYTAIPEAEVTQVLTQVAHYCAEQTADPETTAIRYLMPGIATEPSEDPTYVFLKITAGPMSVGALLRQTQGRDGILKDAEGNYYELNAALRTLSTPLILTEHQSARLDSYFTEMSDTDVELATPLQNTEINRMIGRTPSVLYPDLNTVPLRQVLKTHIINEQGNALLPLRLLTIVDLTALTPINQPYVDTTRSDLTMSNLHLSDSEKERLMTYSSLTRAFEAAVKQYALVVNDTSNLLGHLRQLCRLLQFNSASYAGGVGQEDATGEGTYGAIIAFNEYYETLSAETKLRIPHDVKDQIDLLIRLSSNSDDNYQGLGRPVILTCTATRRTALFNAMKTHETALGSIGVSDETRGMLIQQAKQQIDNTQEALALALKTPETFEGGDPLGLNRALLKKIGVPLMFRSRGDLQLFNTLSPEEIIDFMNDSQWVKQLKAQFSSLEDWVMFCHQTSLPRLRALLGAQGHSLYGHFISDPSDLSALLISFDTEHVELLLSSFKDKLPTLIKTYKDLLIVRHPLSPEQRALMHQAVKKILPGLIKSSKDFQKLLCNIAEEERLAVYEAVKEKLPTFIKNASDIDFVLFYLTPEQRLSIYQAVEKKLPLLIKTAGNLCTVLYYLKPPQRALVYETIEKKLPTLIKNASDLRNALNYLSSEQCNHALEGPLKIKLNSLIKNSTDVAIVLQNLPPEQRMAAYQAVEKRLPRLIKNPKDLGIILRFLDKEQCTNTLTGVLKDTFANLVCSTTDLVSILNYIIKTEPCKAVYQVVKDQLPSLITNLRDLQSLLSFFSPEECNTLCKTAEIRNAHEANFLLAGLGPDQCRAVYEAIESRIPALINSTADFKDILYDLGENECKAVYQAVRDKLPSFINSPAEFQDILSFLGPDDRKALYQSLKDKLPSLIKNTSDFQVTLNCLGPDERKAIFDAVKDRLLPLIKNRKELLPFIKYLSVEDCAIVCKTVLPSLFRREGFSNIYYYLSQEEQAIVYDTIKEHPTIFFQELSDFTRIVEPLYQEKRQRIFDAAKEHIQTLIKSADDFSTLLRYFDHRERSMVIDALQEMLPAFIKNASDYVNIMRWLDEEERRLVFAALKKEDFPTFINSVADVEKMMRYFTSVEQYDVIFEAIREKIPMVIHRAVDFNIFQKFNHQQQCAVFHSMGSEIFLALKELPATADYSMSRYSILRYLSLDLQHEINSLLALMQGPFKNVALALADGDNDQLKVQFDVLCNINDSSMSLFRKRSLGSIMNKLSHLDKHWIERLNTALHLNLSDADCSVSSQIKTALNTYIQERLNPPVTRESLRTSLQQYAQRIDKMRAENKGTQFDHFNVGFFRTMQAENRDANYSLANELFRQLEKSSVREVFSNEEALRKLRIQLMEGKSFHNHGIHSKELNRILQDAKRLIEMNPDGAADEKPTPPEHDTGLLIL